MTESASFTDSGKKLKVNENCLELGALNSMNSCGFIPVCLRFALVASTAAPIPPAPTALTIPAAGPPKVAAKAPAVAYAALPAKVSATSCKSCELKLERVAANP